MKSCALRGACLLALVSCSPIRTERVSISQARSSCLNNTVDFGRDAGVVRADLLRRMGVELLIHRATGARTDADYARRERPARAAGLRWGAYHYIRRGENLAGQIERFVHTVRLAALRNGTASHPVMMVLDNEGADRVSWSRLAAAAQQVRSHTGVWPLLYCSVPNPGTLAFAQQSHELRALSGGEQEALRACGLWVPRYGEQASTSMTFSVPRVFGDWTFWQYCGDIGNRPKTALAAAEFSGNVGSAYTRSGGAASLRHFCDRNLQWVACGVRAHPPDAFLRGGGVAVRDAAPLRLGIRRISPIRRIFSLNVELRCSRRTLACQKLRTASYHAVRSMIPRLALILASLTGFAHASQPTSLADLPDANPDAELKAFVVPEGLEVNLFASEPMIQKPVQMNWDAQGRLWVVSSTTYPHIKPGEEAKDQVVVLEDTDNDGKADKSTMFADGLHIPTALAPGDGGLYVANSTEVVFLKDTNGDLKADERTILLSGFGTEDTHHLLHTMRWGPEGMLYFLQSIYIHSHIETPYGVRRLMGGGVWEFRPETRRLEVISKGLINPWGFEFDRWGQSFACDGAGGEGVNFIFPGSVFATSPGAKRILHGLSPGQPKQSGLEIVEDPHFPADWQGTFVLNDFRGNRVNRFQLTPSGSSYVAKQLPDVLASTHRAFRPIDVKMGPDGALYIADWYNPIIQHGEVDFRDQRRDHVHGRIWRVSAKGRPASPKPKIAGASTGELLEMLKSDRNHVRRFAKRELREQGATQVLPELDAWAAKLDVTKEADAHALLEGAWAREGVNSFSAVTWRRLWEQGDARIRAAALRILSHRWKELPDVMKVLETAVADENAQVRLWALAVLADMRKPAAISLALKTLDSPMDEQLDFLLELTCREQADVWMPAVLGGKLKLDERPKHLVYAMKSTGRSDALPPLFAALKTGRLSTEDAAAVLEVAGGAADVAQAKGMADMVNDAGMGPYYSGLMDALVKAATDRKIIPEGAAETVQAWLGRPEPHVVHRAAILAGLWKVEPARAKLVALLTDAATPPPIRDGALRGLTALGGGKTRDLFDKLFVESQDAGLKALMIDGLSSVAAPVAARRAVEFLANAEVEAAKPVLTAFLKNKQLPGVLAKELAGKSIPETVAVEGIRMVSSRGIQGPLVDALKAAGGVKQMDKPLTGPEMAALVEKVKKNGDPARGEAVYRRQQILCMSCHAIGESGGVLGPNMVSIGASAPVDYLIESLLEPSKKIKEGYHMIIVSKKDGGVVSGGLVNDGAEELTIRDPANQIVKVAKSAVAGKQMSPVSMMPPGLTASLREDEFVDLVRFLSELGREGAYKTQPNRYVRTWKVMGKMEQKDVDHVRHVGSFALNDEKYPYPWQIAFSQVNGDLPLAELPAAQKMYPWFPKILQFGLKLENAGKIKLGFSTIKGIVVAVDGAEIKELGAQQEFELAAGTHRISVLVTRDAGELATFRVEILDGAAVVVP